MISLNVFPLNTFNKLFVSYSFVSSKSSIFSYSKFTIFNTSIFAKTQVQKLTVVQGNNYNSVGLFVFDIILPPSVLVCTSETNHSKRDQIYSTEAIAFLSLTNCVCTVFCALHCFQLFVNKELHFIVHLVLHAKFDKVAMSS